MGNLFGGSKKQGTGGGTTIIESKEERMPVITDSNIQQRKLTARKKMNQRKGFASTILTDELQKRTGGYSG